MELISLFFGFAAICAVVVGPLVLALSLALGKEAFWAGVVLTVAGNAICISGYDMEPVFYVKWLFGL